MEHDRSALAAYVLGALDADEVRAVDAHVAGCAECRTELQELAEMETALGEVPPEAFLDGPPEGGDLLLQRTLRQVRKERSREDRPRRLLVAAGVAALLAVAVGGGTLIGRASAPSAPGAQGSAPPTASATAGGARTFAASNPATGASMTVALTSAPGWVKVHVKAEGIKAGLKCRLVIVDKHGGTTEAGSWLVSPTGERMGTMLDGSALVAPADVASVEVVTFDGQKLVSVPVV
jgi:anti-sigma factor RsiW